MKRIFIRFRRPTGTARVGGSSPTVGRTRRAAEPDDAERIQGYRQAAKDWYVPTDPDEPEVAGEYRRAATGNVGDAMSDAVARIARDYTRAAGRAEAPAALSAHDQVVRDEYRWAIGAEVALIPEPTALDYHDAAKGERA